MDARRKRETERRLKVDKIFLICGIVCGVLFLSLVLMNLLIKNDHNKAVKQYHEDNWVKIEPVYGGRAISGMSNGEAFSYVDDGHFFDGVYVDGVSLGGMDYSQARKAMIGVVEDRFNDINMVVTVQDASLALSANDFNISVNVNEVLQEAYRLGRESINDYGANYRKQQEMLADPVELHLDYKCDSESVAARVANIAEFVNTEPQEPYITVSQRPSANTDSVSSDDDNPLIKDTDTIVEKVKGANDKTIAYIYYNPGKEGYVLNQEDLVDRIVTAFENGDNDCVLSANLEHRYPEKTPSDIKGSIVQITSYTSEFDHDEKHMNRCRNIQKAAGILNGCIVKPGKEISFNKYVGPRTEEGGWLRAAGIVGGKEYEDSPGGGICQVSGTLYNALLQCGPERIKITQRQHHSWPSSYVPIGLDATVDTNGPDLKWRNISDDPIYIFTYADVKKGKMYVYIYGVPNEDGSYYETYAEVVEEKEPPEPKIVKQPLWPTGYEKVTITERIGYTAKAYLMHYDKDGNLIEQMYRYTDLYYPVQGEITVGTGPSYLPKPSKNN